MTLGEERGKMADMTSSWTEKIKEAAEAGQEVEMCALQHVHPDRVAWVQQHLPQEDTLTRLSELFRIFGDGTRISILYVLFEQEVCVCDIATLLGMTQSAVSHQLRILKSGRLIQARREGKTVYYSLADEHVRTLLSQGMEHISEELG